MNKGNLQECLPRHLNLFVSIMQGIFTNIHSSTIDCDPCLLGEQLWKTLQKALALSNLIMNVICVCDFSYSLTLISLMLNFTSHCIIV